MLPAPAVDAAAASSGFAQAEILAAQRRTERAAPRETANSDKVTSHGSSPAFEARNDPRPRSRPKPDVVSLPPVVKVGVMRVLTQAARTPSQTGIGITRRIAPSGDHQIMGAQMQPR